METSIPSTESEMTGFFERLSQQFFGNAQRIMDQNEELASCRSEIFNLTTTLGRTADERDTAQTSNRELNNRLTQLQVDFADYRNDTDRRIDQYSRQEVDFETLVKKVTGERDYAMNAHADASNLADNRWQEIQAKNAELVKMQDRIAELELKLEQANKDVTSANADLAHWQSRATFVEGKLKRMEDIFRTASVPSTPMIEHRADEAKAAE